MIPIKEFLNALFQADISIHKQGEHLQLEAPPNILTPELRQQIAERKTEILSFLARFEKASDDLPDIQPASRNQILPLSFAQERLWFLDQLTPNNPFYNSPVALRLSGTLNYDALQRSLNELVNRHETLRTLFINQEGKASVQIMPLPETGIQIEHTTDYRAVPGP